MKQSGMDAERAIRSSQWPALREALGVLLRELGAAATARVLARVAVDKLRGEPFRTLAPARERSDHLSRVQCGDLILLDRAIRGVADAKTSLALCRDVVLGGALPFMEAMIPQASAEEFRSIAPALSESFFNSEGTATFGDDFFAFEVHRCRFVELLRAVGADHLAPLLCEADDAFFAGQRRPVTMTRTQTLATGGTCCDFHFRPHPGRQTG